MTEAWEWYLEQKELAVKHFRKLIDEVNSSEIPQIALYIKACQDELSEKDNGRPLFSERHVNQLITLAYLAGMEKSKLELSVSDDVKLKIEELRHMLNELDDML